MSVTGHNHDASGAPTYPDYRDRCPVGCDDLTPVRMADTNVQYVGKDRLVTRRLVPDGPSQFRHPSPPPAEPTLDVERLARALHQLQSGPHRDRNPVVGEGRDTCDLDAAELAREYAKEVQP